MNHNKIIKFLILTSIFASIFVILAMPAISLAADSLVPCGVSDPSVLQDHPTYSKPCDFTDIAKLINRVINFILYYMVVPIAAIMFAYAGFKLITAGGEAAHARTEAKEIFMNAFIGLIISVSAWLIIKSILSIVGYKFISDFFLT